MNKNYYGRCNCIWCARYNHQGINSGTVGLGDNKTIGDHSNNSSMIEIDQNSK